MTLLLAASTSASNRVLATGDMFVVTESYVDRLQQFYESSGIYSARDEYLSRAVMFKIFAQEAKSLDMDPKPVNVDHWDYDQGDADSLSLINDIGLAEAYVAHRINNFPVEDKVIVSYYRSNPSHFQEGPWSDADILPLDSDLKAGIRMHILKTARNRIVDRIYDDLKNKHEVQFHD